MNEQMSGRDCDIALIGGGASGVLAAIQLLRQARSAVHVVMVGTAAALAEGVAYSTRRDEHLLNVPAGKMSAFPELPGDFVAFLQGRADPGQAPDSRLEQRYVARRTYADYLRERLRQAREGSVATFEAIHDRVVELEKAGGAMRLRLAGQGELRARRVVLAVGNALRPLPARGATGLERRHLVEAWDSAALAGIPPESAVCIVGSGLSMADSVVTLHARGHRGPVHVVSRHGLMPLPHAQGAAADLDVQALLAMPLRRRMRALRARARAAAALGTPWQSVMDALRPHGQALWRSLSCADQRRFLRHVVRYWDVHRHRIAPEVHARLRGMQASGQLRVHRARLDTVFPVANCVQLGARSAQGGMLQLDAHQVVNATGVEMRVQAMRNPLLQQLLGSGLAVAGPHGIGVDTDDEGCLVDADGEADPRIRVIGSLRIGRLWESLAIPELREQARDVARGLLAL
ncbi:MULTISPECIES: FAD/NAD(P)-binding protein [Gammaproteobacteria]|uniref:FAD/NAD(P)-binding protein n=1 Tax=Gammaproteobacteria TaxID=1236 RepID=UPI00112AF7B1|nr:FAD/NAD(P)-binding protein [Pseudomonas sp. Hp2]